MLTKDLSGSAPLIMILNAIQRHCTLFQVEHTGMRNRVDVNQYCIAPVMTCENVRKCNICELCNANVQVCAAVKGRCKCSAAIYNVTCSPLWSSVVDSAVEVWNLFALQRCACVVGNHITLFHVTLHWNLFTLQPSGRVVGPPPRWHALSLTLNHPQVSGLGALEGCFYIFLLSLPTLGSISNVTHLQV